MLRVISSSPGELQPVFDTMLKNAVHLCEARFGILSLFDGSIMRHAASIKCDAENTAHFIQRWIRLSATSSLRICRHFA